MHSALASQRCVTLHCLQDVELLDDEPDNVIRTRHGRPSKKAGKREGVGVPQATSALWTHHKTWLWLTAWSIL